MNEFVVRTESDRRQLIKMFEVLDISKPWRMAWKLWRKQRSLPANALQHVWYDDIAKNMNRRGWEGDEGDVKDMLKFTFLGMEKKKLKNLITGEWYETEELRHTSDLDSGEACHYMDQIQEWAMQYGILLETPKDCEYRKWCEAQVA